jgi:hypothetical protein
MIAFVPGSTADEADISIDGDVLTIRGGLRPPLENAGYVWQ